MTARTYLTTNEAAAELGVTRNAIVRAIRQGRLPATQPGVGLRAGYAIPVDAWEAYMDRQRARRENGRGEALRQRWCGRVPASRPERLSERAWQAFLWRLDGLTYAAIGARLGVSQERASQLVLAADTHLSRLVPPVA